MLGALPAISARASGPDAAADVLFRQGRQAANAGDYGAACALFEESNRLEAAAGTLLNLADCEENLGQLARAWQHFRELDAELPTADPRRRIAAERARALEPRTPKLRIELVSPVPSTVTRDGIALGQASLGLHIPVDPGLHVVIVSSTGRPDKQYEVRVSEGQDVELTVTPEEPPRAPDPAGAAVPPAPLPDPQPQGPDDSAASAMSRNAAGRAQARRTATFVFGGLGVASLSTGAAFGIIALSQLGSSNAGCSAGVCSNEEAINQFHSARSFALAADVTLGVGIACLGAAIALALTERSGASTPRSGWSPATLGWQF